jgi:asparagine synthetase B (glutamine-hydrolysing)
MYGLIAHTGPSSHRFDTACAIARKLGAQIRIVANNDTVRIALLGDSAATAHNNQAAFYGSGARVSCAGFTTPNTLLESAPDDVIAAACDNTDLIVATGRGNHRIFAHSAGNDVLCSSSLHLLARATETHVDRGYEDFMLGFGFYPDTHTAYSGISAVPAGTRWNISASTTTSTAVIHPEVTAPSSFDAAIPELRDRFFGALEELTAGNTRHAVLLGGFDSMLVAASLRRMGHEVHTYTFTFGNAKYEQRNVDSFVNSLGITHHNVSFTPDIIEENLRQFGRYFTQPGAQAHYQIHTLVASQLAQHDGHSAIFNGDGCDAVFLSYPTVNRRAALNKRLAKIPDWLLSASGAPLRTSFAEKHLGHVARTARSVIGNMMLDEPARGHLPTRYLDDYALSQLRRGPSPVQTETVEQIRTRLATAVTGFDGPRRAFHGNGLTNQSKVKVDGAMAATGLPHFTPYLHPVFRSYVTSLPIDYLKKQDESPAANGKELLVAMVRKYELLPDAIIDQPKQSPVDSPIDTWYINDIRANIITQLADLPFDWNPEYVDSLLSPKRAEEWYRNKVSIGHHTLQAIGLLSSYASFNRMIG